MRWTRVLHQVLTARGASNAPPCAPEGRGLPRAYTQSPTHRPTVALAHQHEDPYPCENPTPPPRPPPRSSQGLLRALCPGTYRHSPDPAGNPMSFAPQSSRLLGHGRTDAPKSTATRLWRHSTTAPLKSPHQCCPTVTGDQDPSQGRGEPQVPAGGGGRPGRVISICMGTAHKEQLPGVRAPAGPESEEGGGRAAN